jgi:hypothetical protein
VTCDLVELCLDALDPPALAAFWAGLLGRDVDTTPDGVVVPPPDATAFRLRFVPTTVAKTSQNRAHFDLTSETLEAQQDTVERALRLGGRHTDVGQLPEEEHVVLADPEGNEFCVIPPGNGFLADCGTVGALSCDGPRAVGEFWSRALGWPLVWDEGEETAVQSPDGGPKISWGGPPLMPRTGRDRYHHHLSPPAGGDQAGEVERLVSLGAVRLEVQRPEVATVLLADPGGTVFCVLPPGSRQGGPCGRAPDARGRPRDVPDHHTDPRVDDYLATLPPWQQEVAATVRRVVHEADPGVEEVIKRTRLPYFVLQGNICALLGAKDHLNVFVYDPVAPDPHGLVNQGQGNATARTIQVREGEVLDESALRELFRAVIANNRAGGWRRLTSGR